MAIYLSFFSCIEKGSGFQFFSFDSPQTGFIFMTRGGFFFPSERTLNVLAWLLGCIDVYLPTFLFSLTHSLDPNSSLKKKKGGKKE